jgi:hypothetical protein
MICLSSRSALRAFDCAYRDSRYRGGNFRSLTHAVTPHTAVPEIPLRDYRQEHQVDVRLRPRVGSGMCDSAPIIPRVMPTML